MRNKPPHLRTPHSAYRTHHARIQHPSHTHKHITAQGMVHSPNLHSSLIARIPVVTE